jgi:hypothetical protein
MEGIDVTGRKPILIDEIIRNHEAEHQREANLEQRNLDVKVSEQVILEAHI